jgi:FAS-associated factor 2
MDVQREILDNFKQLSGVRSDQQATEILRRYNWDIDIALQNTLENNVNTNRNDAGEAVFEAQANRGLVARTITAFTSLLGAFLPGPREITDSTIAANRLISLIDRKYGDQHPEFFVGSHLQALQRGKDQHKLVLLYLHSDIHEDTPHFCKEILCHPSVRDLIEEHFVLWGGDIHNPEAFRLNTFTEASTYPFFAVCCAYQTTPQFHNLLSQRGINPQIARRMGLVIFDRIEGVTSRDAFILSLNEAIERNGPILAAARAEVEERESERILREEQDRAYQDALAADREKELKKREEELLKQQEEERLLREQEELLRQEEQRRLDEERREQEKQKKLTEFPPEPAKGEPNTSTFVIRLTDGQKIQRRFRFEDKMSFVFEFVAAKDPTTEKYSLVTHFPRKAYTDPNQTVKEAGLTPQALLFVEEDLSASQ